MRIRHWSGLADSGVARIGAPIRGRRRGLEGKREGRKKGREVGEEWVWEG